LVVGIGVEPKLVGPARAPCFRRSGGRWLRRAVSLWLVFHLAAITVAPAAVGPSSDLIRSAWRVFRPYLEALYLDHGYHFFAPEPVESTLLAFAATRADGTVVRGRIPDRATRPRLLYHRYFMLTEHMSDAPEGLRSLWHESYAHHLGRKYGATEVTLIQQTHNLPTMERIRGGGRLTDPESYEDQPLGTFPCAGY
jgi:hypothetical protein